MLDTLKKWVVLSHKIERQMKESKSLKVDVNITSTFSSFRYKSPRLQIACNEIEKARMAAGDLVRLWVMGAESRSDARFIPSENGCIYTGTLAFPDEEAEIIRVLKKELRELLYEVVEPLPYIVGDFNVEEFIFYCQRLRIALYDCDRALGLRLGDIYSSI